MKNELNLPEWNAEELGKEQIDSILLKAKQRAGTRRKYRRMASSSAAFMIIAGLGLLAVRFDSGGDIAALRALLEADIISNDSNIFSFDDGPDKMIKEVLDVL